MDGETAKMMPNENWTETSEASVKQPSLRSHRFGPRDGERPTAVRRLVPAILSKRIKVSQRDLAEITSQLAIMIRSGVDVTTSLETLARQCRRPALKAILQDVHADVTGGRSFSEALRRYMNVFGETYIAAATAGEASGRLPEVLGHLSNLQRSELRLRSTVRTLLAYPVVLASVSAVVILGLVLFVLPQFASIFEQFDTPLPVLTRVLLAIADEVRGRYWLWGPLPIVAFVGLLALRFSATGRRFWDRFVLSAVLVRDVTRALLIGRVCRLLGIMIESGVPLLECLQLVRSAVKNSLYRELFGQLEQDVLNGRGLGRSLIDSAFVPPGAAEMMVTAERTGTMGPVMQLIGQHYEEEGESKLRELVTILEPAITCVMGVVVAFVVLSVMLPMFDLASLAQHGS